MALAEEGERRHMDELIDWCRRHRQDLQRQLELIESGLNTYGSNGTHSVITTDESKARIKGWIADLDRLLAKYAAQIENNLSDARHKAEDTTP
jgi:hypothetical protein